MTERQSAFFYSCASKVGTHEYRTACDRLGPHSGASFFVAAPTEPAG